MRLGISFIAITPEGNKEAENEQKIQVFSRYNSLPDDAARFVLICSG